VLLNGSPATQFSQQDITTGFVSYQNDSTANATDSFDFSVDDGAGSATTGTFSITIRPNPGDYDQNLTVETADYVLWRKTLGTTGVSAYSGADGDGDGTIDQDDYGIWRAHFGQSLPPPAAATGAGARALSQSTFENPGGAVVPVRAKTTVAAVETKPDAARQVGLAMLEARAAPRDLVSRPLEQLGVSGFSEFDTENLLLLLAINRLGNSSPREVSAIGNFGSDQHSAVNVDSHALFYEPITVALAEWQ
jgi:hypothetical protein